LLTLQWVSWWQCHLHTAGTWS